MGNNLLSLSFLNPLMIFNCWMLGSRRHNGFSVDVFVLMRSFANLPKFQPIQKDKPSVRHQILSPRIISEPDSCPLTNSCGKCGTVVSFHLRTRYQNKNVSILYDQQTVVISFKTKREGQREVQAKKKIRTPWSVVNINSKKRGGATAKPASAM